MGFRGRRQMPDGGSRLFFLGRASFRFFRFVLPAGAILVRANNLLNAAALHPLCQLRAAKRAFLINRHIPGDIFAFRIIIATVKDAAGPAFMLDNIAAAGQALLVGHINDSFRIAAFGESGTSQKTPVTAHAVNHWPTALFA